MTDDKQSVIILLKILEPNIQKSPRSITEKPAVPSRISKSESDLSGEDKMSDADRDKHLIREEFTTVKISGKEKPTPLVIFPDSLEET